MLLGVVAQSFKQIKLIARWKRTQHFWPTTPNIFGSCCVLTNWHEKDHVLHKIKPAALPLGITFIKMEFKFRKSSDKRKFAFGMWNNLESLSYRKQKSKKSLSLNGWGSAFLLNIFNHIVCKKKINHFTLQTPMTLDKKYVNWNRDYLIIGN